MKNLIESIRVQIYERLTSPLFGSFVVARICWNYRFVAIVLSGIPIEQRFSLVDTKIFPSWIEIGYHGTIGPISTAVLFILLYPRVSKFFFEEWLKKQVETKELRDKIEKTAMLTVEESQMIQLRLIKAREQFDEMLRNKDQEIKLKDDEIKKLSSKSLLTQMKESALESIQQTKVKSNKEAPSLQDGTLMILKHLAQTDSGSVKKVAIYQLFPNQKRVRVDYYFDEGKKKNFGMIMVAS